MSIQAVELVFSASRATGGNRLVLLALASHAGSDLTAWPGVETLRKKAGFNHGRSVTRRVAKGQAVAGLIDDGDTSAFLNALGLVAA